MAKKLTTLSVIQKDKDIFRRLVIYYKTNQQKLFHKMIKIINQFKPEMEEELKWELVNKLKMQKI